MAEKHIIQKETVETGISKIELCDTTECNVHFNNTIKVAVPSSPTDTGTEGQWAYDGGYHYKCVATDTWIREIVITAW